MITPEATTACMPIGELDLPSTPTDVNAWNVKDLNIPGQAEPHLNEAVEPQPEKAGCAHQDEVILRIDPDEIGEWDFIPTRAIVCLGCEAVRWA